jgi:predicted transcriptional regulator
MVAVIAIAALSARSVASLAADDVKTESRTDGKTFIVRPYLWAAGLEGDVGVGDIGTEVDLSFSDILDTLQIGGMLEVEGRSGRWGVIVDGIFLKLSEEAPAPGPFFSFIEPTIKMAIIDAALAYRVIDGKRGWLDLLAGGRYFNMDVELDLSPDYDAVDDISSEVVSRTASAIRDEVQRAVNRKAEEIAEKLADIRDDISEHAEDLIRDEVRGRVEESIDDVLDNIGDLTPGPQGIEVSLGREGTVGDIIKDETKDRAGERLQEIKNEIRDAIAERAKNRLDEISGTIGDIREKIDELERSIKDEIKEEIKRAAREKIDELKRSIKNEIKEEIQRAAQERIDELKRKASAAAREELNKAEEELATLIEEGMNEAANKDVQKDRHWVDPYVGLRGRYNVTDKVYLGARGDIGGFGVGGDLTWQVFGGLGYVINHWIVIEGGWRHLSVDYDDDEFALDVDFSGPTVSVGFIF